VLAVRNADNLERAVTRVRSNGLRRAWLHEEKVRNVAKIASSGGSFGVILAQIAQLMSIGNLISDVRGRRDGWPQVADQARSFAVVVRLECRAVFAVVLQGSRPGRSPPFSKGSIWRLRCGSCA
jgi:hypothetical protein